MKAALILESGQPPVYGDFPEPVPSEGENHITVTAASLSHVTRGRAEGSHYSASGQPSLVYPQDDGLQHATLSLFKRRLNEKP